MCRGKVCPKLNLRWISITKIPLPFRPNGRSKMYLPTDLRPSSCSIEAQNVEVADIFRRHINDYQARYKLHPEHYRVASDIMECRTPYLGGHIHAMFRLRTMKLSCTTHAGIAIVQNARLWPRQDGLKTGRLNFYRFPIFIRSLLCPMRSIPLRCATSGSSIPCCSRLHRKHC